MIASSKSHRYLLAIIGKRQGRSVAKNGDGHGLTICVPSGFHARITAFPSTLSYLFLVMGADFEDNDFRSII
jgi:hypothetical protein